MSIGIVKTQVHSYREILKVSNLISHISNLKKEKMEQLALFAEAGQSKGLPKELLEYVPGFIDRTTSDSLLEKFIKETPGSKPNKSCGIRNT